MPSTPPRTSARLARAAQAERDNLKGKRDDLLRRRDTLRQELDNIEMTLVAVDDQVELLERLSGGMAARIQAVKEPSRVTVPDDNTVLRGPDIRRTAARLLISSSAGRGPIHYRDLLTMLHDAGYTIAGKDQPAVLLSQITRSPVIRKVSGPGRYELNVSAPDQLRRRLAGLHSQLRELTSAATDPSDLAKARTRRVEIIQEISVVEKALEEAITTLTPNEDLSAELARAV